MLLPGLYTFASKTNSNMFMEQEKTTYNTLPERIDYLISEIKEVKALLIPRVETPKEIPKFLDKECALRYLRNLGYNVSSSKFYKMTAENEIPCHRSGRRLYFLADELGEWLKRRIEEESRSSGRLFPGPLNLLSNLLKNKGEIL